MKTEKFVPVFALLVLVAALSPVVSLPACYVNADPCSVEVVLNKPGVSYVLTPLVTGRGVEAVSYPGAYSAYVYKSHYSGSLVVVVTEQCIGDECPRTPPVPKFTIPVSAANVSVDDIVLKSEEKWRKLGWKIGVCSAGWVVFRKAVGRYNVYVFLKDFGKFLKFGLCVVGPQKPGKEACNTIKSEVESLVSALGFPGLSAPLCAKLATKAFLVGPAPRESFLAVRVQVPLRREQITRPLLLCSVQVKPSNFTPSAETLEALTGMGWNSSLSYIEGRELVLNLFSSYRGGSLGVKYVARGNMSTISLEVRGSENVTEDVRERFAEVLSVLGFNESLVRNCEFTKTSTIEDTKYVPLWNFTADELRKALIKELEWLESVGVITGLTKQDIEAIAAAAAPGYAGWNMRLVWHEGSWVPYMKSGNHGKRACRATPPWYFVNIDRLQQPQPPQRSSTTPAPTQPATAPHSSGSIAEYYTLILIVGLVVLLVVVAVAYTIGSKYFPLSNTGS